MIQATANGKQYKLLEESDVLGKIYAVGQIYITATDTDPKTLFGGVWEKLEGVFLLGTNSKHALGSKGGKEQVTLTTQQMPKHNHEQKGRGGSFEGGPKGWITQTGLGTGLVTAEGIYTEYEGGGQPVDILPPYVAVNIWKRTA